MSASKKAIKATLPEPHVPEISGGKLHFPSLNGGPATAEVNYGGIKAQDSIVLSLDRLWGFYQVTHVVSAAEASSGKATIKIDNAFLEHQAGEPGCHLSYVVNGTVWSRGLAFTVTY